MALEKYGQAVHEWKKKTSGGGFSKEENIQRR